MAARYAEMTNAARRAPRKAMPRLSVELACAGGGPQLAAALVELSTFGCRLGGDGVDGVGDHVRLGLEDGPPVAATVIWRQSGMIGCRFDKPIATTLMKALIGRA